MSTSMQTKDMTQGNALKHIFFFAIPLFIGNIFQQIYNLVDTMIAGHHLGDNAIASIGATSTVFSLIMSFATGLNTGYTIIVTQHFGAHNDEQFKKSTSALVILNAAIGLLITVTAIFLLKPVMRFLNVPDSIYAQAYRYILIICIGMPATMAYNMFAGFLRAVGNSRTPLYFLILSSLLNIGMDFLLIVGFNMGVSGAALATVLAQICSAVFCGLYIWKNYAPILPHGNYICRDKKIYKDMLSAGAAMAMMNCIFSIGSVIMQRAINSLNETIITAHTSARKIIEMSFQPLGSIAAATSTFTGQNWGAGHIKRIETTLRKIIVIGVIWGTVTALVIFAFGERLIILMTGTTDPVIIDNAVMNLRINFFFYPSLSILLTLRMSMQAIGQKIPPLFSSSLEMAVKFIAAFLIVPRYGYLGASLAEPLTWLLCSILLGSIYLATKKNYFNLPEAEDPPHP